MSRASLDAVVLICLAGIGATSASADPGLRLNTRVPTLGRGQALSPSLVFDDTFEGDPIGLTGSAADRTSTINLVFETDSQCDFSSGQCRTIGMDCAQDHCVPSSGMVPATDSNSQTWVMVAPYWWVPDIRGTIGVGGIQQSVHVTIPELLDLIPDLNGYAMGHVEVGKGRRGLIFDGMFLEVSPRERDPLGGSVTVDAEIVILEVLGMYRVLDIDTGRQRLSNVNFDVLGGVRYNQLDGGLTIVPIVGPTISPVQAENWVDLVIGVRGAVTIAPGLDGFARADIGGFGIGTSSKLAWSIDTGIEYACGWRPGMSLRLGYKILDIDESKNSGTEEFVFDMTMQGPFAALTFRF